MKLRQINKKDNKKGHFFAQAFCLIALLSSATGRTGQAPREPSTLDPALCGVVEKFGGEVQLLGPARQLIADLHRGTGVPCGGWVSTDNGWVTISHRNGASLTVGPKSFIGLRDERSAGKETSVQGGVGDHVILYRGEVQGVAGRGQGSLNVITPNARARLGRASAIVIYSAGEEDTQVIALEDAASIENRFEPARKITVKAGEASSLNFRLLRVVPSAPRAIAQADLRPHLVALHVPARERSKALANAYSRGERRLAAAFPASVKKAEREPASEAGESPVAHRPSGSTYERNPPDPQDAALHAHMVERIVGGDRDAEKILYPDRYTGRAAKAKIQVEDADSKPEAPNRPPPTKEEDTEKRRLIDALSKVNDD